MKIIFFIGGIILGVGVIYKVVDIVKKGDDDPKMRILTMITHLLVYIFLILCGLTLVYIFG